MSRTATGIAKYSRLPTKAGHDGNSINPEPTSHVKARDVLSSPGVQVEFAASRLTSSLAKKLRSGVLVNKFYSIQSISMIDSDLGHQLRLIQGAIKYDFLWP